MCVILLNFFFLLMIKEWKCNDTRSHMVIVVRLAVFCCRDVTLLLVNFTFYLHLTKDFFLVFDKCFNNFSTILLPSSSSSTDASTKFKSLLSFSFFSLRYLSLRRVRLFIYFFRMCDNFFSSFSS